MHSIDIIIVNYNSTGHLLKCLGSIDNDLEKHIVAAVYIFDNASEEDVDILDHCYPYVHLVKSNKNIGFARAVNYLITRTRAPNILILNPDTLINKGFFRALIQFMDENPDAGVAGPKIFEANGRIQGSARSFPTLLTSFFGRSSMMTRYFPNNRLTRKNILNRGINGDLPVSVDWVSGACMIVRRIALEEVGLLDEKFFMYWEDADWCRRMTQKGWKVFYCPCASLVHHAGVSSEHNIVQSIIEFHKSAYYLFTKYSRAPLGFFNVIVILGLAVRACFLLAVHGIRRLKKQ